MGDFYLIDINRGQQERRKIRVYLTAAKIIVKYGGRVDKKFYTENRVREFWQYDDPLPSPVTFYRSVTLPNIKWFIKNYIHSEDEIWNSDFLHGMSLNGQLKWNKRTCPSLHFRYNNKSMIKLIQSSPFGGRIGGLNCKQPTWKYVAAFYMSHSEESLSFIAGVLSGGEVFVDDKKIIYAKYLKRVLPHLKKWGIPIENIHGRQVFISPFWPALFSIKMPEVIREDWIRIKKVINADYYAPILWKIYVNNTFPKNGIPYLKSRRKIYYDFKCEEGAMKKLEKLRVEMGLVELDHRVRDIVKLWAKRQTKTTSNKTKGE